ncbi:hypothetical protein HG537_0G02630 [Torulaspora globosa]|uniref:Uncharacterized protein n=1 Tax=Torulaspora globosa TaxID=48254 RepID=A0A7H9HY06_9SACH|nr:hypothetical protein HG537_0G02630 [Torulaspora sp. CBS 2947]
MQMNGSLIKYLVVLAFIATLAHCEFHWITTDYHAPNNITTAFLACLESELGHLAYNVSHDPLNRINIMPREHREMNETEYAAIIKCQEFVGGHDHFTYQGSRYEDEWTLSSTYINILNTGFDYSTYTRDMILESRRMLVCQGSSLVSFQKVRNKKSINLSGIS